MASLMRFVKSTIDGSIAYKQATTFLGPFGVSGNACAAEGGKKAVRCRGHE
jgi:hypothetical protein